MKLTLDFADLQVFDVKIGELKLELHYSADELALLANTYAALAPALVAALAGETTTTAFVGRDGETIEQMLDRMNTDAPIRAGCTD